AHYDSVQVSCQGIGPSTSRRASFQPCRMFSIDLRAHRAQLPKKPPGFSVIAPYRRGILFSSLTARLKPMPFHGGSRQSFLRMALTTRNGPDHNKWLFPGCDCIGERGVGRLVGEVFFAGEEAQEGAALLGVVVADGAAQHGIAGFERVQHRALRDRAL